MKGTYRVINHNYVSIYNLAPGDLFIEDGNHDEVYCLEDNSALENLQVRSMSTGYIVDYPKNFSSLEELESQMNCLLRVRF